MCYKLHVSGHGIFIQQKCPYQKVSLPRSPISDSEWFECESDLNLVVEFGEQVPGSYYAKVKGVQVGLVRIVPFLATDSRKWGWGWLGMVVGVLMWAHADGGVMMHWWVHHRHNDGAIVI
jgi:hypothetical protein